MTSGTSTHWPVHWPLANLLEKITPDKVSMVVSAMGLNIGARKSLDNKSENFVKLLTARCREKPLILAIDEAHTLNQTWGEELFEEVRGQNKLNIDTTITDTVKMRVNATKEYHYKTYSDRLVDEHLLPHARRAGELINANDGHIRNEHLIKNIEKMALPPNKTALDTIKSLHNIGYIWQGDLLAQNDWNLAIPSLTDYIKTQYKEMSAYMEKENPA